jgi:hypothetical protein
MTTGMLRQQLFLVNGNSPAISWLPPPELKLYSDAYSSFDRILLSLWDVLEVIAAFSLSQWTEEMNSTAEYPGIRLRHPQQ